MTDDGGLNGSWETAAKSDTKEELVAATNLLWTSDENVYGEQADAKVATLGDPIPIEDQIRDALQRGLSPPGAVGRIGVLQTTGFELGVNGLARDLTALKPNAQFSAKNSSTRRPTGSKSRWTTTRSTKR